MGRGSAIKKLPSPGKGSTAGNRKVRKASTSSVKKASLSRPHPVHGYQHTPPKCKKTCPKHEKPVCEGSVDILGKMSSRRLSGKGKGKDRGGKCVCVDDRTHWFQPWRHECKDDVCHANACMPSMCKKRPKICIKGVGCVKADIKKCAAGLLQKNNLKCLTTEYQFKGTWLAKTDKGKRTKVDTTKKTEGDFCTLEAKLWRRQVWRAEFINRRSLASKKKEYFRVTQVF